MLLICCVDDVEEGGLRQLDAYLYFDRATSLVLVDQFKDNDSLTDSGMCMFNITEHLTSETFCGKTFLIISLQNRKFSGTPRRKHLLKVYL